MQGRTHALFLTLVSFLAAPAWGWDSTKIVDSGDPANRVNIVVLGDGYRAGEMATYAEDTQFIFFNDPADGPFGSSDDGVFFEIPFEQYKSYVNVYRVDVISSQSGVDNPATSTWVNTALDCCFGCQFSGAITCDESKIYAAATDANVAWDYIIVMINSPVVAGSGFSDYLTLSRGAGEDLARVALHESGHVFPDPYLADEYYHIAQSYGGVEPPYPNCTVATQLADIKWKNWIAPGTQIPTPPPSLCFGGTDVGAYEGCAYYYYGIYRPTCNSMMRSPTFPYESVNTEAIVKQIYTSVSPIETYCPKSDIVKLLPNRQMEFSVTSMAPTPNTMRIDWYLDGVQLPAHGTSYTLSGSALTIGMHTLKAEISDRTGYVRNDPDNLLKDSRVWRVNVGNWPGLPPSEICP